MRTNIREPKELLDRLTNTGLERNIYVHPNKLARDIFWQRLEVLLPALRAKTARESRILDFGGGSGGFLKGLATSFNEVDIIDLDPQDAQKLCDHHRFTNVKILTHDINTWAPTEPYDLIVATDVLEHFKTLEMPIQAIHRFLKKHGKLAISVPTENWLYLLGRILVNKTKPADHYHAGEDILKYLEKNGFRTIWKDHAPHYLGVSIPLFRLAILEKTTPTEATEAQTVNH